MRDHQGLGESMMAGQRGIPASKVARDFGESLASFTESVHALIGELDKSESPASALDRCRETCAALWAATVISMEASALRAEEREALTPLVFATLRPYWKRQCGAKDCTSHNLQDVAQKYLKVRHTNQVTAAAELVTTLFGELAVNDSGRRRLFKRLSALFAHRMLGDIHRLNEIRMHYGIQMTALTGFISALPLLHGVDGLLRLLRLC
jgi:hypothetical protein